MNINFKFHLFYRTAQGRWEHSSSFTHSETALERVRAVSALGFSGLKFHLGKGNFDDCKAEVDRIN